MTFSPKPPKRGVMPAPTAGPGVPATPKPGPAFSVCPHGDRAFARRREAVDDDRGPVGATGARRRRLRLPLELSDDVSVLLAVVAAHDRISQAEFVARAVVVRAEAIGITNLALQGGEAASRLAHNQKIAGANPAPATTHNPESEKGPEGVPRGALRSPPKPP